VFRLALDEQVQFFGHRSGELRPDGGEQELVS
jgi:hypothetical protein